MKNVGTFLKFVMIPLFSFCVTVFLNSSESEVVDMVKNIHWFGQAAVKITVSGKVIYIDPYRIKNEDDADIVLITHAHSDHLSPVDIAKVVTPKTTIVAPESCMEKIKNFPIERRIVSEPGMKKKVFGILIEAVPAYNVVKTQFHPKSNRWVGYIITVDGIRIYHAGDTERIPEMKQFHCDIALLPLGQTYTMNSIKEAAEAAIDVKAKIAIPIHYGLYEGKNEDADAFKKYLEGKVKVVIKK